MAAYHTRSNSLPSRPHPFVPEIYLQICRLKASEAASSSSSSIGHKLNGLQDLHDCVDKLLLLPSLAQEKHEKSFDELLDGSLWLLDLCSTTKDALLQTKESTQELQSIMRRRCGSDNGFTSEARKYLASRKAAKKAMQKALGDLKVMKNRNAFSNNDNESILKEVEAITLHVFESLLSFISGPKEQSKISGWSLVSKLMHHKRVACAEEETEANEFAKVDASLLQFLIGNKTCKSDNMKQVADLQNQLKNLELCIQDFEDGLECLYRRLIKTRVALLNILNH